MRRQAWLVLLSPFGLACGTASVDTLRTGDPLTCAETARAGREEISFSKFELPPSCTFAPCIECDESGSVELVESESELASLIECNTDVVFRSGIDFAANKLVVGRHAVFVYRPESGRWTYEPMLWLVREGTTLTAVEARDHRCPGQSGVPGESTDFYSYAVLISSSAEVAAIERSVCIGDVDCNFYGPPPPQDAPH